MRKGLSRDTAATQDKWTHQFSLHTVRNWHTWPVHNLISAYRAHYRTDPRMILGSVEIVGSNCSGR